MNKAKQRKKRLLFIVKAIALALLFGLLVFIVLLIYFQTPIGKAQVAKQIELEISHLAPEVEVIGLEGRFPWHWEITKISGSTNSSSFEIDHLKLRLSPLSPFFTPLRISSIEIEKARLSKMTPQGHQNLSLMDSLQGYFNELPVKIKLPSLAIDDFLIHELIFSTEETPSSSFAVAGSLDLRPHDQKFKSELSLFTAQGHKKLWDLHADLQKRNRFVFHLETFEPLNPELLAQLNLPKGIKDFLFDLHAEGPLATFQALFNPSSSSALTLPLTLQVKGHDVIHRENLIKLRMFLNADRSMEIAQIDLKLPELDLQGHLNLTPGLQPSQGFLEFDFKGVFAIDRHCHLKLPLKGQIEVVNHELIARGSAKQWSIDEHIFEEISFSAKATYGTFWQGNFAFASDSAEERLLSLGEFTYNGSHFNLDGFRLELPALRLHGETSIDLATKISTTNLFVQTDSLGQVPCASLVPIDGGKAAFELRLFPLGNHQGVEWSCKAEEGAIRSVRFESMECRGSHELSLDLPLSQSALTSSLQIEAKKVHWKWNFFENLDLQIQKNELGYSNELHVNGISKKPFYLDAKWFYADHIHEKVLTIHELNGSYMKLPITLSRPCSFQLQENSLRIHDLDLRAGSGLLQGSLLLSEPSLDGTITTSQFPLSILSCLSSDASLEGTISSEWNFHGTAFNPQGNAWIELQPTVVRLEDGADQLVAKGSARLFLDHQRLQGHLHILSAQGQVLEAEASLPLKTSPQLLSWEFAQHNPFSARLRMEGKIEELIPFLKFDAHRIEGKVNTDLFFSKTLETPLIQGNLFVQDGLYENIPYGTHLKEISLTAVADRDRFIFEEGSGIDGKGGSLAVTGKVILSPSLDYPFDLFGSLQKLEVMKSDFAEASVSGDLRYKGTLSEAKLSGVLHSEKLELKIPDKLTETIPHIDIDFIRLPSRKIAQTLPHPKSDLLILDLDLQLKDKVFVSGRGLSSEWKGNLKIGGTSDHILPTGSLELLRGKFLFSGKTFNLSEGRIVFNGKELTPDIRLEGNLGMSDLSVTVVLQGPLNSPQLSFQSIPHLPTSSLLSRLLFNKDVSEINPVQAYQLAETLMSLSGSGVNILEAIQKSLGIDKLSLVSSNNRFDEVSLQIGKYLYKGVMVTLSQSASSSEVMVEVELKKGFILQAETVEDDGKFTLKWNYNY